MQYFKSRINYGDFIVFCLFYPITAAIAFVITSYFILKCLIILLSAVFIYIAMSSLICRYDFYDDMVICNYLFSIKKKQKAIYYKDIKLVRYTIESPRHPIPIIIFQLNDKKILASHSNSCSHSSFKKRKEILMFLKSKGVGIEISPIFNIIQREREILS